MAYVRRYNEEGMGLESQDGLLRMRSYCLALTSLILFCKCGMVMIKCIIIMVCCALFLFQKN
jgi:hypothetical protein